MINSKEAFFSKFENVKKKTLKLIVPGTEEELELHALGVKDKENFVEYAKLHGHNSMRLAGFLIVRASSIFEDEDIEAVCDSLSNAALSYISREILTLSGLVKEAEEEAGKN